MGPFLTEAFSLRHPVGTLLSPAQRTYLLAVLDREELWRAVSAEPWFRGTGLPEDHDACRAFVEASKKA